MSIADVVKMAQDTTVNSYSTLIGVDPAQLSGTMPQGAKVKRVSTAEVATPIEYRVSDGYVPTVTTLQQLISAYPVPASPTPSNTASMARLHFPASCGIGVCSQEGFRVAFGASGSASFYLCDYDTSTGIQSNCTAAGTGSYALGKAADGVTPIMTFSGLPSAAAIQTFTRVFVERNSHVYYGWQDKPGRTSKSTRLNKVAFEALAAVLGITPPTIGDAASAYVGTWNATYAGSDTGACASVVIDATGYLSGSCTSSGLGGTFVVSGQVTSTGTASFTASGGSSSGASFTGSFVSGTGSGTWVQSAYNRSGTWHASKP
jgi:hypothetical protein